MSLVSSRIGLRHRCTIQRDAAAADSWGGTATPDWQDSATNVPCRAVEEAGREPVDKDRTVVILDRRLLVPLGTDVTERDRISSITERGTDLLDGPVNIEAVLTRRTHLELLLQKVR